MSPLPNEIHSVRLGSAPCKMQSVQRRAEKQKKNSYVHQRGSKNENRSFRRHGWGKDFSKKKKNDSRSPRRQKIGYGRSTTKVDRDDEVDESRTSKVERGTSFHTASTAPILPAGNGLEERQDAHSGLHRIPWQVQRLAAGRVSLWGNCPNIDTHRPHLQRRKLSHMFEVCALQSGSLSGRSMGKRL